MAAAADKGLEARDPAAPCRRGEERRREGGGGRLAGHVRRRGGAEVWRRVQCVLEADGWTVRNQSLAATAQSRRAAEPQNRRIRKILLYALQIYVLPRVWILSNG